MKFWGVRPACDRRVEPSPAAESPRPARRLAPFAFAAGALALLATHATPAAAQSRTIDLYFSHTGESLKVVYKRNGQYVPSAVREINHFLRDWRRNESTKMDPELLDLLWETQQHFGGKQIRVVSAYRSPATNAMLRGRSRGVAKHSQHMLGKATDFFIPGVNLSELRAWGVSRQVGGVGYYPSSGSPFVHFDTGSVRAWPRMSRSQLAKIFPDGKTLHLPADGKPLSGYAAAQQLEKQGKLARLDRRGGGDGGGGGSLFAGILGGGGGGGSDRASDRTRIAAVDTGVIIPGTRSTAPTSSARTAAPEPDAPVRVRTASLAPATESAPDEGGEESGFFRQLPSVSLGGLIDRFRDEDEGDEAAASPEVVPVALPSEPLTAVETPAEADAPAEPAAAAPAVAVPVPAPAPRPETGTAAPAAPAAAPEAPEATDAPVVLAALPPQRPSTATASDAASALGYAVDEPNTDPASPLNATVALVPRPPLPTEPEERYATASEPAADVATPEVIPTAFSPVRGATQQLIADSSGIGGDAFASLSPTDRDGAASGGVLMAQGFLGAPSGFSSQPSLLSTERFTGLTITVFAKPRS